jgi:hypothetical protein
MNRHRAGRSPGEMGLVPEGRADEPRLVLEGGPVESGRLERWLSILVRRGVQDALEQPGAPGP